MNGVSGVRWEWEQSFESLCRRKYAAACVRTKLQLLVTAMIRSSRSGLTIGFSAPLDGQSSRGQCYSRALIRHARLQDELRVLVRSPGKSDDDASDVSDGDARRANPHVRGWGITNQGYNVWNRVDAI